MNNIDNTFFQTRYKHIYMQFACGHRVYRYILTMLKYDGRVKHANITTCTYAIRIDYLFQFMANTTSAIVISSDNLTRELPQQIFTKFISMAIYSIHYEFNIKIRQNMISENISDHTVPSHSELTSFLRL